MTSKTCVTRYSYNIFIWWHHLTWHWPWPVFSIGPLLIWYARHRFSIALWQSLGLQLCLVWSRQPICYLSQPWRLTWPLPDLDLTFNWHLTSQRNFKTALESHRWEPSIAASCSSLCLLFRKLDGGWRYTPPPPANGRWLETPALHGLTIETLCLGTICFSNNDMNRMTKKKHNSWNIRWRSDTLVE